MEEPRSLSSGSGLPGRGLKATVLLAVALVVAVGVAGAAYAAGPAGPAAGVATASALLPSPTWTHPVPTVTTSTGTAIDVTACYSSTCHADKYSQWLLSSPYTDGPYGELKGHNVTLAEAYTNVGHNTEEPLVNDCQHCMSPF